MMNIERLGQIVGETTIPLRKGEPVVDHPADAAGIRVTEVFDMPHVSEAGAHLVQIDVAFFVVGVDTLRAERHREELVQILRTYPRLKDGPSYIEVGAEVGDQEMALRLFGLGEALKLWKVMTPAYFHFEGAEAQEMAGKGLIMISGFKS